MAGISPYAKGFKDGVQSMFEKYESAEDVKQMIGAFAIALNRTTNMEMDDILTVLSETQAIWNESVYKGYDIVAKCFNETGIDIQKGE